MLGERFQTQYLYLITLYRHCVSFKKYKTKEHFDIGCSIGAESEVKLIKIMFMNKNKVYYPVSSIY